MSTTIEGASAATPSSDGRRISIVLTSLAAGAAGCLIAYWTWRMVLSSSGAESLFKLSDAAAGAGAGAPAPWWVPTAIAGVAATALWRLLANNASRMSLVAGSATIVLVSILIFPVAAICTEFAAVTANGFPPILDFLAVLPRMVVEAVRITFVNLLYCGLVTVPIAAVVGLLLAGFGRLVAWSVERIARWRAGRAASVEAAGP